jgi:SAM-dependent methyltransferase
VQTRPASDRTRLIVPGGVTAHAHRTLLETRSSKPVGAFATASKGRRREPIASTYLPIRARSDDRDRALCVARRLAMDQVCNVTDETFDRDFWERRWAQALREHPDKVASRPPNAHLVAEIGDVAPGLALDAGCGHGAEAIWLAASGWRVTAVDFSVTALEHARAMALAVGADVAERIEWIESDLGSWEPPPRHFDLVSCLYVNVAGSVSEMVTRLATGVAPGGTLFLVGHLPEDPATGEPSPAAGQVQVTVEDAVEGLDSREWKIVLADERTRAGGTGGDAVVRAVYQPSRH